jgi:hypothetical protein
MCAEAKAKHGNVDCWPWPRRLNPKGYGRVDIAGRAHIVSRLAFSLLKEPAPHDLFVCHHCDNPKCFNPEHLYLGTAFDNMRDMVVRKRGFFDRDRERAIAHVRTAGKLNSWSKGANNPNAKLSAEAVATIKCSAERTGILAARYSVGRNAIIRIRSGLSHRGEQL